MGLKDNLESTVDEFFRSAWSTRDGREVPSDASLTLGNDAVKINATVLYADLADSTKLVDDNTVQFAAEIYKSFLHCAAKVVRDQGGTITAYDGDRVMAVYLGVDKNTSAMMTAFKIRYAVRSIVEPLIRKRYPHRTYSMRHVVGIDTSDLFVARTGVRGANDLVWVGRAANYAAKLSSLSHAYATYVTKDVYDGAADRVKTFHGRDMWERATWSDFGNQTIYRTNEDWPIV
jgi:class 3 adenylate cyclase